MDKLQPLSAKLGEVNFRRKLVHQNLDGQTYFPTEPSHQEILKILQDRIKTTKQIFQKLEKMGLLTGPFLEIGAERGQRAMVLTSDFKVKGYACDLSFESLSSAKWYAKYFKFKKLPTLVCADAYHLPFGDGSFPFVFCFETLHHFPDPTPIIKEIYRVLRPGGVFYFAEEPVKQMFNLALWRRGYRLNKIEEILRKTKLLIFLSRIGKAEVCNGVLEEEFSLGRWKKALSVFEKVETEISPIFIGPKSSLVFKNRQWSGPSILTQFYVALQGGGLGGLCYKKPVPQTLPLKIEPSLICPDCKKKLNQFSCPKCHRKFKEKNGVLMLLPIELQKKLYG